MTALSMRRHRKRKLKAEINVVPYIDVMLVLLIIFMVTAPLLTVGIEVRLPQLNASAVEQPKQQIVVQIDQDGRLSLIQEGTMGATTKIVMARDQLVEQVAAYRDNDPELMVFVAGAGAVRYESV